MQTMNDKKKYYMRGLGCGILVTAIILMAVHARRDMTDEKAIKRAKELGYVLSTEVTPSPTQIIDIDALKEKMTEPEEHIEPLPNGDPLPEGWDEPLPNGDPEESEEDTTQEVQ